MEDKIFKIARIEGEYAYLKDEKDDAAEELFIAMALLPVGVDEGSRLLLSNFEYRVLN